MLSVWYNKYIKKERKKKMNLFSYFDARDRAQTHKTINHYTTLEALEKIIGNQSLLLTRVDCLNDIVENAKIIDLWKNKVYVSCFTHREYESVFFWDTYAKHSSEGVMITFKTNNLYNLTIHPDEKCLAPALDPCSSTNRSINFCADVHCNSWGIFDYSCLDVFYIPRKTNIQKIDHYQGRLKHLEWDLESETRIRVAIRPLGHEYFIKGANTGYFKPYNEHLYAKLPLVCLETMSITLSPYADDKLKEKIETLLMSNGLYGKVKVKPSQLFGEV